jgi:hypothetical protein
MWMLRDWSAVSRGRMRRPTVGRQIADRVRLAIDSARARSAAACGPCRSSSCTLAYLVRISTSRGWCARKRVDGTRGTTPLLIRAQLKAHHVLNQPVHRRRVRPTIAAHYRQCREIGDSFVQQDRSTGNSLQRRSDIVRASAQQLLRSGVRMQKRATSARAAERSSSDASWRSSSTSMIRPRRSRHTVPSSRESGVRPKHVRTAPTACAPIVSRIAPLPESASSSSTRTS